MFPFERERERESPTKELSIFACVVCPTVIELQNEIAIETLNSATNRRHHTFPISLPNISVIMTPSDYSLSGQMRGEFSAGRSPLQSRGMENTWLRGRGDGGGGGGDGGMRANIEDIAI